jgi:hypothetical protein
MLVRLPFCRYAEAKPSLKTSRLLQDWRPSLQTRPADMSLLLTVGKYRQVKQEVRALWTVRGDRQMAVKLPYHAHYHLEAQTGLRLINVEALWKAMPWSETST